MVRATDACTCITIAELLSSQLQGLVSSNVYVVEQRTNGRRGNTRVYGSFIGQVH
jgi:hypothetical protein